MQKTNPLATLRIMVLFGLSAANIALISRGWDFIHSYTTDGLWVAQQEAQNTMWQHDSGLYVTFALAACAVGWLGLCISVAALLRPPT